MSDHDHPYRLLFSDPDLVRDLLSGFVGNLSTEVDLGTLERVNGTFITQEWKDRESDMVWKVRWQDQDLYVYLLLEFQSSVERDMVVRMLDYVLNLWRSLRLTGVTPGRAMFPPILPMVLYNGDAPWNAPVELHDLISDYPASIAAFQPVFRYVLIDEQRIKLSPRQEERNLVAALFALEQASSQQKPIVMFEIGARIAEYMRATGRDQTMSIFVDWWDRSLPKDFHRHPVPNPFKEEPKMIKDCIIKWREDLHAEGRAEGEANGLVRGIVGLVATGDLTRDRASVRLHQHHEQGRISPEQLAEALRQLA